MNNVNKMKRRMHVLPFYFVTVGLIFFFLVSFCMQHLNEDELMYSRERNGQFQEFMLPYKTKHRDHRTNTNNALPNCSSCNKTVFKFYIYEFPGHLNEHLINCKFTQPFMCADLQYNGMGSEIFSDGENGEISFRNSSQFSLAVIIHNKLMTNRLRTWDPNEADVFYVPVYFALKDWCNDNQLKTLADMDDLRNFLSSSSYMLRNIPHISTLDLLYIWMPGHLYLTDEIVQQTTFITMEGIFREKDQKPLSEIVSPYPSYGHFLPSQERILHTKPIAFRNILILLPVGNRNASANREILKQQFPVSTGLPYKEFIEKNVNQTVAMVMFYTNECSPTSSKDTIKWLQNSVFCIQPAGDTETRKSFYDSIMCGCIPVIVTNRDNPYPFQRFLDYNLFTIFIPFSAITIANERIYDILRDVPLEKIESLHFNLRKVARYFQYSMPNGKIEEENDALQLIFMALSDRFSLPYDKDIIDL